MNANRLKYREKYENSKKSYIDKVNQNNQR